MERELWEKLCAKIAEDLTPEERRSRAFSAAQPLCRHGQKGRGCAGSPLFGASCVCSEDVFPFAFLLSHDDGLLLQSKIMMSSDMPSAKYSCSGSPLILTNGSTAMEGRSGAARSILPMAGVPGRGNCSAKWTR